MASTIAIVRHRVANFDAWKTFYDSLTPIQAENGVRGHQVLRSKDDRNDVVVSHTFDSIDGARAFFAIPELKGWMRQGGVRADTVSITYFDELEVGTLFAA
jgi:quinol monooxygenase YgiN